MKKPTMKYQAARTCLLLAALMGASLGAQAQDRVNGPYVGGALGSTDGYGTALRVFGGAGITNIVGWEASVTSFGTGHEYVGQTRSANELGVSVLAHWPLANTVSVFGKLGLHFVDYSDNRYGRSDSGIEPGLSLGLQWRFTHNASARVEMEHIGGAGGDSLFVGALFHF
jgi:hypothetical protein